MQVQSDSIVCPNCSCTVLIQNIDTHQAYCQRYHKKCYRCGQLYDDKEAEEHQAQHQKFPCPDCGQLFEKINMSRHLQECLTNKIPCDYCRCPIRFHQYPEHAKKCGGRAYLCPVCDQSMCIRHKSSHKCMEIEMGNRRSKLVRKMSTDTENQVVNLIKNRRPTEVGRLNQRKKILKTESLRRENTRNNKNNDRYSTDHKGDESQDSRQLSESFQRLDLGLGSQHSMAVNFISMSSTSMFEGDKRSKTKKQSQEDNRSTQDKINQDNFEIKNEVKGAKAFKKQHIPNQNLNKPKK